jgi:hypothetical protein
MSRSAQLTALRELIVALDRRIRHPDRASEQAIAIAAECLKDRALAEIGADADDAPVRCES